MTIAAGIDRPVAHRLAALRHLAVGYLRFAADLTPGVHVQLGDGRWAVVADGDVVTDDLGRVSVPVVSWPVLVEEAAESVDPERLLVGWGRRVRTRTPEEQRAYVEAVWAAGDEEGKR